MSTEPLALHVTGSYYKHDYIPPRCRKPRPAILEHNHTVYIQRATNDNAPIVAVHHKAHWRHFNGAFYAPLNMSQAQFVKTYSDDTRTELYGSMPPFTYLISRLSGESNAVYRSEQSAAAYEHNLETVASRFLLVDGTAYQRTNEPLLGVRVHQDNFIFQKARPAEYELQLFTTPDEAHGRCERSLVFPLGTGIETIVEALEHYNAWKNSYNTEGVKLYELPEGWAGEQELPAVLNASVFSQAHPVVSEQGYHARERYHLAAVRYFERAKDAGRRDDTSGFVSEDAEAELFEAFVAARNECQQYEGVFTPAFVS